MPAAVVVAVEKLNQQIGADEDVEVAWRARRARGVLGGLTFAQRQPVFITRSALDTRHTVPEALGPPMISTTRIMASAS